MAQQTILVTGGAGFIGSHINKELNAQGFNTLVFDNLSTGTREAVTQGTFVEGDLADKERLSHVFQQFPIDGVMHFAAHIDVGASFAVPLDYYQNNVANTLNLLQAMVKNNVDKLVFSSSAGIFGLPQTDLIDENHPTLPINPYGRTKLMVEQILKDAGEVHGLRSCCLRYFNAAGGDPSGEIKNRKTKETNLIPVILHNLKDGKPLYIFGTDYPTPDGTCVRDYVHVLDLATAHIQGLRNLMEDGPSKQYNLGNGQGFSIRDVIRTAEDVTGLKVEVEEGPRRPGDPPRLVASAEKARAELGWAPKYPELATMVRHAWGALR